jgi:RNA polymerase sigma factor (TIGR02999 family)
LAAFDNHQPDAHSNCGHDVTQLLAAIDRGDDRAHERLLTLVYDELRAIAGAKMANEPTGHTLQPTALVHEAYIRLLDDRVAWKSRGQFFAAASLAMRRILVDRARRVRADKRGGDRQREELTDVPDAEHDAASQAVDLIALDEALTELERRDERLSRVVQLRVFAGMGIEQIAIALECSERTVKRDWAFARAWLQNRMDAKPSVSERSP